MSDDNFAEDFAFLSKISKSHVHQYRNGGICFFARRVLLMENKNNLGVWKGLC